MKLLAHVKHILLGTICLVLLVIFSNFSIRWTMIPSSNNITPVPIFTEEAQQREIRKFQLLLHQADSILNQQFQLENMALELDTQHTYWYGITELGNIEDEITEPVKEWRLRYQIKSVDWTFPTPFVIEIDEGKEMQFKFIHPNRLDEITLADQPYGFQITPQFAWEMARRNKDFRFPLDQNQSSRDIKLEYDNEKASFQWSIAYVASSVDMRPQESGAGIVNYYGKKMTINCATGYSKVVDYHYFELHCL